MGESMGIWKFGTFAVLGLVGACSYDPQKLTLGMQAADSECNAKTFKTVTELTDCYNEGEHAAWRWHGARYLTFYQAIAAKRTELAAKLDAKEITSAEFTTEFHDYREWVYSELKDRIEADAKQQVINQQQANDFMAALLVGAAGYAAAKNGAYASAPTAPAPAAYKLPPVQHTNCSWVFGSLECTTTTSQF
jgi:hypothetical protein